VTASLFGTRYPVIAVLHLLPLPGAPRFGGSMPDVIARMTSDLDAYKTAGVDAVIVENFADVPFFPDRVPSQTVESMTAAAEVARQKFDGPMGINVLRTDALSALEIAAKVGAQFIRVNVHMHPVVSEQGILVGRSHETLRRRAELGADVQIWADAAVKHGRPLVEIPLADEVRDLVERGCADSVIISGSRTGVSTSPADIETATTATEAPVYVGSGVKPETVGTLARAGGFIVGSSLKRDGMAGNEVEPGRAQTFMQAVNELRNRG
jgi:membrane complex biogenesis BtpA family protein